MKANIQLFVPTFHVDECLAEIRECLEKGWTGIGFKTNFFEDAFKAYTCLPNAHFLNSSTAGLHLAIKIYKETLGWEDHDEVITTPLTFVSPNHAILYEKLKPVFADIDDTLCLDPESIENKITSRTRAVMYVGIGGNTGRLSEVLDICLRNDLILILDAAHMAGTKYNGAHIGRDIDCSVFSFQAVKNLPTGDAGMICFSDQALDDTVRKYSWLGINKDTYTRSGTTRKASYKWLYDVEHVGLKAHGNSIMAAIGIVQLKYLDVDNKRRRAIASLYKQELSHCPQVRFIKHYPDCQSSRHLFQIRVPGKIRDQLIETLNDRGVFPGVHYRINTDYRMFQYAKGTCPNAEQASQEIISLPLHLRLTDEDVAFVSSNICNIMSSLKV